MTPLYKRCAVQKRWDSNWQAKGDGGMKDDITLLDYFAGQALVGLLAAQPDHVTVSGMPGRKIARDEMADEAYWYADRMLKRRNNEDI